MKKIVSLFFILFMVCACGQKYQTITTNEALKLFDDGATIIDVRTEEEYNESHIKGAVNIPLDTIDTITYDKNETLIIYCASGVRSVKAINKLVDMGYISLYNLDGGLINWGSDLEE